MSIQLLLFILFCSVDKKGREKNRGIWTTTNKAGERERERGGG
jgi:hypothetical protein